MSRADRLIEELKACRGPYPYRDIVRILVSFGFEEETGGGGSGRKFYHPILNRTFMLHEPHPGNEVHRYIVRSLRAFLEELGLI
ncbi:type II toxin-antitoxin system HicA family toxin [Rhizobium leguminosarum]|uniref:type II toxin-antitoxin system HicA family toxin n=1 Tax=Rhizobium leguminosarum TaxID=384 RepID=UPI003D00160A